MIWVFKCRASWKNQRIKTGINNVLVSQGASLAEVAKTPLFGRSKWAFSLYYLCITG